MRWRCYDLDRRDRIYTLLLAEIALPSLCSRIQAPCAHQATISTQWTVAAETKSFVGHVRAFCPSCHGHTQRETKVHSAVHWAWRIAIGHCESSVSGAQAFAQHRCRCRIPFRPDHLLGRRLMPPALFVPFRALGYITDDVPFAVQRRGRETFVTVSVGKSWQVSDWSLGLVRAMAPPGLEIRQVVQQSFCCPGLQLLKIPPEPGWPAGKFTSSMQLWLRLTYGTFATISILSSSACSDSSCKF